MLSRMMFSLFETYLIISVHANNRERNKKKNILELTGPWAKKEELIDGSITSKTTSMILLTPVIAITGFMPLYIL